MTMLSLPKNNRYRIVVEKWTINIASLWKLTIVEVYNAVILGNLPNLWKVFASSIEKGFKGAQWPQPEMYFLQLKRKLYWIFVELIFVAVFIFFCTGCTAQCTMTINGESGLKSTYVSHTCTTHLQHLSFLEIYFHFLFLFVPFWALPSVSH